MLVRMPLCKAARSSAHALTPLLRTYHTDHAAPQDQETGAHGAASPDTGSKPSAAGSAAQPKEAAAAEASPSQQQDLQELASSMRYNTSFTVESDRSHVIGMRADLERKIRLEHHKRLAKHRLMLKNAQRSSNKSATELLLEAVASSR